MPTNSLTEIDGTHGFRYTPGASGDLAGVSSIGTGEPDGDGFARLATQGKDAPIVV